MPRSHVSWKSGRALYRRRVPTRFAALDPRGVVKFALGTADPALASVKAAAIDSELEAYWAALEAGAAGDAAARRAAIVALAEARGLTYRPIADLAEGPLTAILERLERLAERGEIRADPSARPALEAELGLAPTGPETLEDALERFYALTPEIAAGKSADQLRRARLPKAKAVRNLRQVIGPKPFHEIDDADALAFRGWWAERLAREGLTANAANKDISHLSAIWSTIERLERRGIRNPFQGLKFAERDNPRLPIAGAFVARRWLSAEGRAVLAKLNAEAAAILLGLVNTGLRPSELIGVAPGDLVIDGPLPHVVVRPSPWRDVKTPASRRVVPLAGCSLEALRAYASIGFPRYREKPTNWSNAVNKFLRENALLPTKAHSVYGLRHDFEDRLTDLDCPERVKADLMGHRLKGRPRYGAGPTLARMAEWVRRISVD
ncbi:MAG: DUF6538 domain-containing protein [Pseudomonadota bacterium]